MPISCLACTSPRPGEARSGESREEEEEDAEEEREDSRGDGEQEEENDDDGDEEDEDDEEHYSASPTASSPKTPPKAKKVDVKVDQAKNTTSSTGKGDIIKIVVQGELDNAARFETRLEASVVSQGKIMTPLQTHHRISNWTVEADYSLLEFLNSRSTSKTSPSYQNYLIPKKFFLYQGQALSRLTLTDIVMRSILIETFNKTLEALLPLIDLSNDDVHSFGAMIRKSNRYLLMKIKLPLLEKAISSTAASSGNINGTEVPANFLLDNYKALSSREKGDKEPSTSQNCFVQAFRQLQKKDSAIYRYIISGDRVFSITFADER